MDAENGKLWCTILRFWTFIWLSFPAPESPILHHCWACKTQKAMSRDFHEGEAWSFMQIKKSEIHKSYLIIGRLMHLHQLVIFTLMLSLCQRDRRGCQTRRINKNTDKFTPWANSLCDWLIPISTSALFEWRNQYFIERYNKEWKQYKNDIYTSKTMLTA